MFLISCGDFRKKKKQSKEWLQLQVLEMSPDMTRMGDSFIAASDLLMAHQDVLKKLQVCF